MTIRIDQIANAIVAAPGVTMEMLNKAAVTTRSTTSTSFVGIGVPTVGEPGDIYQSFNAPLAGKYLISVRVYTYGSGGN